MTVKDKSTPDNNVIPKFNFNNPADNQIMELLDKNGAMTRAQLVKASKIARSTIYDILVRLMIKRQVYKFSEKPTKPGRPKVYFDTIEHLRNKIPQKKSVT